MMGRGNRNRTRNGPEFLDSYRAACREYERAVESLSFDRARQTGNPEEGESGLLEAHVRAHLINPMLWALNWPIGTAGDQDRPGIAVEAPVRSASSTNAAGKPTIRFLDYFGVDREEGQPLLIVETKRPSDPPPELLENQRTGSKGAEAVVAGLNGGTLAGSWREWIDSLRDYVRSIANRYEGATPARVVITNGTWLLIFLDPGKSFADEPSISASEILYCRDRQDVERQSDRVFAELEHGTLLGRQGELGPGSLGFKIAADDVRLLAHALRVRYTPKQGIYGKTPLVDVAPVILVQSRAGAWLYVGGGREFSLPNNDNELPKHLEDVRYAATNLLLRVQQSLGSTISPTAVAPLLPSALPIPADLAFTHSGIEEKNENDYYVLTGDATHFLTPSPNAASCPYHDWAGSNAVHAAAPARAIDKPSVDERSFFLSGTEHHCSHADVHEAKGSGVGQGNQAWVGSRTLQLGASFCIIWPFERFLCCQNCVFVQICTAAPAFNPPCGLHGQGSAAEGTITLVQITPGEGRGVRDLR